MTGMKILGPQRLSRTLVKGSKTEYEMKNTVKAMLYWVSVMLRSSCKPATLAFPIFVLFLSVLSLTVCWVCVPVQKSDEVE